MRGCFVPHRPMRLCMSLYIRKILVLVIIITVFDLESRAGKDIFPELAQEIFRPRQEVIYPVTVNDNKRSCGNRNDNDAYNGKYAGFIRTAFPHSFNLH